MYTAGLFQGSFHSLERSHYYFHVGTFFFFYIYYFARNLICCKAKIYALQKNMTVPSTTCIQRPNFPDLNSNQIIR